MSRPSVQARPPRSEVQYRLVRPRIEPVAAPVLDKDQLAVVHNRTPVLKVLAGPGTGKTTTLVEAVVERVVDRGVPIDEILVLTFGRRAAAELRDRITARLGRTVREPVARTIHSYAYGVLRLAAMSEDQLSPPRLLVAAEQDVVLRDLLTSDEPAAVRWPSALAPALATQGFADELRDFIGRAVERGLDADGLSALAGRVGRPDWAAAAQFLRQYREVTSLLRPGAFDTAELVASAIDAFDRDPELLARERAQRRHLFVDEYQDVDPAQAQLLTMLAAGAAEYVVVGDPDQSIYAFRGSEPRAMADAGDGLGEFVFEVPLRTSRRSGSNLLAASRRVAAALGHDSAHHVLVPAPGSPAGELEVAVYRSPADEAAAVAAALRRAHLDDDVPWSRMAVLVRSVAASGAVLRRALVAAGVPVEVVGDDVPLSESGAVDALLQALEYVTRPTDAGTTIESSAGVVGIEDAAVALGNELAADDATIEAMLLGPIGRADPLTVRRLRRQLARDARTRSDDLPPGMLARLIDTPGADQYLPASTRRPVQRLARVLTAGRDAGGELEATLWALWTASGLPARWESQSVAGGLTGQAADRELDAVVELFEAAARYADAFENAASVEGFLATVRAQFLPVGRRSSENPDVVRLLTAHAAKGLEWDLVCVAAVQDGLWPDLRRRSSLLRTDLLTDVVSGIPTASTDQVAVALAEERRLFYVAVTRARRRLLVSAVRDAEQSPSRFLDDLDPQPRERPLEPPPPRPVVSPPRGLHLTALVAELRAAVTDPSADPELQRAAAAQLAELAEHDVPGAHPDTWWGLGAPTTSGPIRDPDAGRVRISPSRLDAYQRCQLRALLEELGARDGDTTVSASLGTVVHAVAADAPDLADVDDLEQRLDVVWRVLDFEAPWHAAVTRVAASRFLDRLTAWFSSTRSSLRELGVEIPMQVDVGTDATLVGRVDRLELDDEDRTVVVDLKTSSKAARREDLAEHPQLAAYQLAVSLGAFDAVPGATRAPGGGRLVQLKATLKNPEQEQPALTDPGPVAAAVEDLAGILRGADLLATVNTECDRCAVRRCCPSVPDGRQVTS